MSSDDSEDNDEIIEPTAMMAAPTTGSEPSTASHDLQYRHSVLSANALTLDDMQQDSDRQIDEEIKQNLKKQEAS